jgi:hypothetical protein
MGGQPNSGASSLSSPEVRALREEPTEAIPQNQRERAEGILTLPGIWEEYVNMVRPLSPSLMYGSRSLAWRPVGVSPERSRSVTPRSKCLVFLWLALRGGPRGKRFTQYMSISRR